MLTQNRQFQWYNAPSYIYPLIPASAATVLAENNFHVLWNDCIAQHIDRAGFWNFLEKEKPNLLVIETKTPVVRQHWKLIDEIKLRFPETRTMLIGDHVTAFPEESLRSSSVDYVAAGGHYDVSVPGLAAHLRDGAEIPAGLFFRKNGSLENTGPFARDIDLNALPFIDRELTNAALYGEKWKKRSRFYYTLAGRDCPWGKCTFCAWTVTHPKFQVRSPENLLDEIGRLIEKQGAREIFDDTGTFPNGEWLLAFCRGMINRRYNREVLFSCNMRYGNIADPALLSLMKHAGFRKVKMGLESANQATLDRLNKGTRVSQIIEESKMISRAGIDIQLTVMVGYPWETRDDAARTINLARGLMERGHAEMLQSTVVVPYPGTRLHSQALENGWFRGDVDPMDYERYDMRETLFSLPGMTSAEVQALSARVYRSFLAPKFIVRQLLRIRSWRDLDYIWRGMKAVIGHLRDFLRNKQSKTGADCTLPQADSAGSVT
jgi:radical SAM superfamily enzyme YgiQ (UPF0313 family)